MGPLMSDRINPLGCDENSGVKCCDSKEVSGVNLCFVLWLNLLRNSYFLHWWHFVEFSCSPGAHVLLHNQGEITRQIQGIIVCFG